VEFFIADGVTDEEACRLIALHPISSHAGGALSGGSGEPGDINGWSDNEGLVA